MTTSAVHERSSTSNTAPSPTPLTISYLRRIGSESEIRHRYIGNWLYCPWNRTRKKIPAPKGSMAKRKKERGGGEARSGPEGTRVGDRKELEEGEVGGGSALDPTSAPAGTQGRLVQQQLLPVDLHQARPQPMDEKPTWRRPRTTDKKTLVEEWVENVSSNGSNRWDDWPALAQPAPY